MTEEETFRRLRSLTPLEAEIIYDKVWTECCIELESYGADISGGIPIDMLRERSDIKLKPYGWTFDMLFDWNMGRLE
jgi:hypothetical protein